MLDFQAVEIPKKSLFYSALLATLLSVFFAGLGHFYLKKRRLGAIFASIEILMGLSLYSLLASKIDILHLFYSLLVFVLLSLIFTIFVARSAYKICRKMQEAGQAPEPQFFESRSFFTLLCLALIIFYPQPDPREVVQLYNITSSSMIPTLLEGDYVLADKREESIDRGDVVIFWHKKAPSQDAVPYVKRAVGIAEDLVEWNKDSYQVNNKKGLIRREKPENSQDFGSGTEKVPEGYFFAIGDNYYNSLDSRKFGPVTKDRYIGKARYVLFSYDNEGTLRQNRRLMKID